MKYQGILKIKELGYLTKKLREYVLNLVSL